ncbi:MAG: zincin-like metallopeptidase domain-containing protein [bacterium]
MQTNEIKAKITAEIVESLKTNQSLWSKSWKPSTPQNYESKHAYSGINNLILTLKAMNKSYQSPFWLTFKQVDKLDHSVLRGEKSTMIVFYSLIDSKNTNEDGEKKKIPLLKYYNLFNTDQTTLKNKINNDTSIDPTLQNEDLEQIINTFDCPIVYASQDRAFYRPIEDKIYLPTKGQFKTIHGYYATAMHEMAHATGHERRLKRDLSSKLGSMGYAKEELIAEIATMFILGYYSIDNKEISNNNIAYINSWLKLLQNDSNFIFTASKQAGEILEYITKDNNKTTENKESELIAA